MFYETARNDHGLPHDPFKSCVVPRPIGWITTLDNAGLLNLAPFSYFNACGDHPPQVMYAPSGSHAEGGAKDSLHNVQETGEFVASLATWEQREAMRVSSSHVLRSVDEFALAGLETEPARLVRPPRVKGAPIHLECRSTRSSSCWPTIRGDSATGSCSARSSAFISTIRSSPTAAWISPSSGRASATPTTPRSTALRMPFPD